jgi:hypothetical protein
VCVCVCVALLGACVAQPLEHVVVARKSTEVGKDRWPPARTEVVMW